MSILQNSALAWCENQSEYLKNFQFCNELEIKFKRRWKVKNLWLTCSWFPIFCFQMIHVFIDLRTFVVAISALFPHIFGKLTPQTFLLLECMSRIFSMCRFCGLDDRHGAGWLSKRKLEYWLRVHILSYCCWAFDELLMKVICHWIQNLYTLCTHWRKGVNREKPFLHGLGSWAVVNKDRDQKKKQIF